MEVDGFPPCSAPSAQWGEGRADKVIYLHLSTSCNGWNIHLSLKLHHLTAAPPLTRRGVREKWNRHATHKKSKHTNLVVTSFHTFSLRLEECGNMTLSTLKTLNHSPTSSKTKILDRSQLHLIATGALIDSSIPLSGICPLGSCAVFSAQDLCSYQGWTK